MKVRFLLFAVIVVVICGGTVFGTLWNVDFESNDFYSYKETAVGASLKGGVGQGG